ncbi:MAG: hypothetical protein ABIK38_07050 [candidate division WOR-3 bacterium]
MVHFLLLVVINAFDFLLLSGTASGIGAGTGVADWQQALIYNPAQTMPSERAGLSIVYARPYGVPELNCARLGAGYSINRINLNAGMQLLGIEGYGEYDFGVGLGLAITDEVITGVAVHGLLMRMPTAGWLFVPAFDGGILWSISKFRLGTAVQNFNRPRFDNGDEVLPRLRAGVAWEPVEPLLLAVDFGKQGESERLLAGIEVRIFPELKLRAGMETAPWCIRAGCGLKFKHLGIDYGYHYLPELGGTHMIGVNYTWN